MALLALTWPAGAQSGTEANGRSVEQGAEVAPAGRMDSRGSAATMAQTTLKESKFCH